MARLNSDWKVGPHGQVETLDDGLVTATAELRMPLGNFPRRMTVVRLKGGRVAVWSAIPLAEPEMKTIEMLGAVAFLIVPGIAHRLDIKAWKQRYPEAQVLCPPGARAAVEEAVRVDATADVLGDPAVEFLAVPGVAGKEGALLIHRRGGTTLVLNDLLANVRQPHGLGAQILARLLRFGVRQPEMPRIAERMFVKDSKALAGAFRAWAALPDLKRVVVSHGDVIEGEVRPVLLRIAAGLDR